MNGTRLTLTMLPFLCFGSLALAQDTDQKKAADPSAAQKEYKQLKSELDKARRQRMTAYRKAFTEARKSGKSTRGIRRNNDFSAFTGEFMAAAKKYAKTEGAISFLTEAITVVKDRDIRDSIVDTLIADHIESAKLLDLATKVSRMGRTLGKPNVEKLITALIEKSPHDSVKGAAYYSRGSMNLRADKKVAVADMRKAVKFAPKQAFAKRAKGIIYEAENLQIGMIAPDIEGEDIDGVAFKLSDYKGKVIMLDFWGDW